MGNSRQENLSRMSILILKSIRAVKRIECLAEIRRGLGVKKEHIFVFISIWRGLGQNRF